VSLRTKLLAVVVGLNALVLLAALLLLVGSHEATPPSALAYLLGNTREQVGTHLERWSRHVDGVWLVEDERTREPVEGTALSQVRVYDARGWFEAPRQRRVDALPPGPARERALEGYRRALPPEESLAGRGLVVALLDKDREPGRRWALVAEVRDGIQGARRAYLVMLLGLGVVFLVTWVFLSRSVVRPLDDLTRAAVRVAAGDVTARLPAPTSDDELSRTAAAFNLMADEIHEYQARLEERVLTGLEQIKKAEQHLAVAERLVATGKLAAGIAHEINNPLGGMKNAARALARGDLEPEKRAQYLELIQDGLQRVEETVKKVLAFTPRRVEPRPIDLGPIVQRALALAQHRIERRSAKVEVVLPKAPEDARVFGDPLELQQVALNLLLNAADALPPAGGLIRIEVVARGEEVAFVVADNGSGLSLEAQARCFDLFFTTKDVGEGTGLGLSVAHNIVTNHGGRIELVSEPGQGATFTVYLPRESLEPGPAGASPTGEGTAGGGAVTQP
jgi:signal transduction histidine kinase